MAASPAAADRAALLDVVRVAGGVSAAEVADRAGLPVSTARDHLDALVAAGLLAKARASAGLPYRPAWRYRAVTDDPTSSAYGRLLTAVLEHLGDEAADRAVADRVGRRWGGLLADACDDGRDPVDALVAVLDALGFTPRVAAAGDTTEVWLRTCPYLALVRDNPDAMCRIHAGVIRGALHRTGADDDTAVLEPFAGPEGCVVRLPAAGPDPSVSRGARERRTMDATGFTRDRDGAGRARNSRPRDALGRPLPYGLPGVPTTPEDVVLSPAEALEEAQRLLDDGRPFHAHEVLEGAWKQAPEPERELWRGLAQLAVGVTHRARGNDTGAARLLQRAADRIAAYAGTAPHDIDAAGVSAWAAALADRLQNGGTGEEPPVRLTR
ncbi:DUF309 domain-containing protein [Nucisporomicrobium flavum]|uniref:DUF309 domain-containing protein n=1 Tax=Nucisporomicrobium flavum TaxID=2785915 RepID=UPI0018F7774B|nr:DUF309 domain-containing protein [Nucisporomicrobium flavum]